MRLWKFPVGRKFECYLRITDQQKTWRKVNSQVRWMFVELITWTDPRRDTNHMIFVVRHVHIIISLIFSWRRWIRFSSTSIFESTSSNRVIKTEFKSIPREWYKVIYLVNADQRRRCLQCHHQRNRRSPLGFDRRIKANARHYTGMDRLPLHPMSFQSCQKKLHIPHTCFNIRRSPAPTPGESSVRVDIPDTVEPGNPALIYA